MFLRETFSRCGRYIGERTPGGRVQGFSEGCFVQNIVVSSTLCTFLVCFCYVLGRRFRGWVVVCFGRFDVFFVFFRVHVVGVWMGFVDMCCCGWWLVRCCVVYVWFADHRVT